MVHHNASLVRNWLHGVGRTRCDWRRAALVITTLVALPAVPAQAATNAEWAPVFLLDYQATESADMRASYQGLVGIEIQGTRWHGGGRWGERWGIAYFRRRGDADRADVTWDVHKMRLSFNALTCAGTRLYRLHENERIFSYVGVGAGGIVSREDVNVSATRSAGREYVEGVLPRLGVAAQAHALLGIQMPMGKKSGLAVELQWIQSGPAAIYEVGWSTPSDYAEPPTLFTQQVKQIIRSSPVDVTGLRIAIGVTLTQ